MAALIRLNNKLLVQNCLSQVLRNARLISTSQKKSDTATIASCPKPEATSETAAAQKKNWVNYGFDFGNKTEDRSATKSSFFFSVTLCLVWGTFIWAYLPDNQLRDWSQREAYLELRRREAAGLEPIDPNYIDPSKIDLPSDEELGDTEIII